MMKPMMRYTKEELITWLSQPEVRLTNFQMNAQYGIGDGIVYEVSVSIREDGPKPIIIPKPVKVEVPPPIEEVRARVEQIVGKFSTPS
jgi:hypothetical protein